VNTFFPLTSPAPPPTSPAYLLYLRYYSTY
jgi:hypothetical protein